VRRLAAEVADLERQLADARRRHDGGSRGASPRVGTVGPGQHLEVGSD
jgi:hypothetical protein